MIIIIEYKLNFIHVMCAIVGVLYWFSHDEMDIGNLDHTAYHIMGEMPITYRWDANNVLRMNNMDRESFNNNRGNITQFILMFHDQMDLILC